MNSSQQEWFVVRSKSRKEDLAVRSLERRGIAAFCPRIIEPIGWTNDWATVPLFPGYLFVEKRGQAARMAETTDPRACEEAAFLPSATTDPRT